MNQDFECSGHIRQKQCREKEIATPTLVFSYMLQFSSRTLKSQEKGATLYNMVQTEEVIDIKIIIIALIGRQIVKSQR